MEHKQISTVSRQLKRTLGERTLNDLGRATRFCRFELRDYAVPFSGEPSNLLSLGALGVQVQHLP